MTRRIAFLCDWLPPDFGAIGQYTLLQAREAAASGDEVTLGGLSSRADSVEREQHYDGTLSIYRVAIVPVDKQRMFRRILWTVRANGRLVRRLWPELRRVDEIHFTGSPPFILHFVWAANLVLRKRLVYRIADFHPECIMAAMQSVPFPLRLFHALTVALRRRIDQIEVIGEDQRRRLLAQGVASERVIVKRYQSPVMITRNTRPQPTPTELTGYATLLYSGNWGLAHEYKTFVEGYRRHHQEGTGRVALWLNATGQCADTVERMLRELDLPIARSYPVPLEQLAGLMVAPEAHLVTLRDTFVGYVVPSKVHACIDSGRPVVFVGSTASDVDLLCRESLDEASYHQVDVGDVDAVFGALERLAALVDCPRKSSAAIVDTTRVGSDLKEVGN